MVDAEDLDISPGHQRPCSSIRVCVGMSGEFVRVTGGPAIQRSSASAQALCGIFPTGQEAINGVDDDCDGLVDDNTDAFDDGDGQTENDGDCNDAKDRKSVV